MTILAPQIAATPTSKLVRILLAFERREETPTPEQRQIVTNIRAELRRREVLPVASELYRLGPPIEDSFCEEEDGP